MQGALDTGLGFVRLGDRLGLFRLLRDQHPLRCRHHGPDRGRFGFCLAPAQAQISSFCRFLVGPHFGLFGHLFAGCGMALGGHLRRLLVGGAVFDRTVGHLGQSLGLGRGSQGLGLGSGASLLLLAFLALQRQFLFLAADQLGLSACFLFAPCQFGMVNHRRLDVCSSFRHRRAFRMHVYSIVAPHKCALLANFHLDGARLSGRVGLLDLGRRFLDQRDLLALRGRRAMTGVQIVQQAVLVRVRQSVGLGGLGDTRRLELLKQRGGGFLELVGELGDGRTGHVLCYL